MKKKILTLAGVMCFLVSFSQISEGGKPVGIDYPVTKTSTRQQSTITLNQPTLEALKAQDDNEAQKGGKHRVGSNLEVNLDANTHGVWQEMPNGTTIWRLSIKVPNAKALGLYYDEQIWLPKGGKLFLYNQNHLQIIGAFTAELNNEANPIFATELIEGDVLTLEYNAPKGVEEKPRIKIGQVVYFYRGVHDYIRYFKEEPEPEDKAQSCEVNVACSPESNGWQDQIDAVVHYTFSDGGSTYVCSGAMINNAANDCKPYLLTANHCGEKTTNTSFNNNVWYFKYENPNCSPGTTSAYAKPSTTMTGAIFRASSKNGSHTPSNNSQLYGSDFTLCELNSQPPASYQVYYAGWDMRNTAPTSGVSIHHPAGHDKKISTYTSALQSSTYNGGLSGAHWEVVWAPTSNGHGVTEGGSSGSPIFNQDKRIVGDLSGGSSYCSTPYSSDLYGKLSTSWSSLGTNANAQLKAWLDPNNSGVQFINGKRPPCGVTAPVANFSASPTNTTVGTTVNFSDLSTNSPTSWSWSFSPNTVNYLNGTNASSANPKVSFTAAGTYTVTLVATNNGGSDSEVKSGYITITAVSTGCTSSISNFPYNESFENGTGTWSQSAADDLDWINQSGSTPSSNTGPTGATDGTKYLFIEASNPNYPSKTARLISPCFDLSGLSGPSLSFSYHMYGSQMGTLNVRISTNNGSTWSTIWTKSADQGNAWINANVSLSSYSGTILLQFEGITGSGFRSDMAIDKINISGGTVTPPPTGNSCSNGITAFPYNEGFESGLGAWAQSNSDDLNWINQSGGTPSSGTGPAAAQEGTKYMYIEASSPNYPSKTGILTSPCFNLSASSTASFTFAYHMYGASMGSLKVQVSTNNGTSWVDLQTITADQGNAWKISSINMNSYIGQSLQLRFVGTTGSGYQSDICIDDLSLSTGSTSPPVTLNYCTPSPTNGTSDGDYIGGVSLGSISNLNSGGTGTASYKDYTAMGTTIAKGSSQTIQITEGGYSPDRYAVWIDYNQDGDFNDASEKLGEFTGTAVGSVKSISFTVPNNATSGTTRLRVRCLYNGGANNLDPCTNGDWGETEDYSVTIGGNKTDHFAAKSMNVESEEISLHPNPSKGIVYVEFTLEEASGVEFEVFDLMGKRVLSEKINFESGVQQQALDLTHQPKGLYLIVFKTNQNQQIKRVVIH